MKLQVGVLFEELDRLSNWQLRILAGIQRHPNLNLVPFALGKSLKKNMVGNSAGRGQGSWLLCLQRKIEKRFFRLLPCSDAASLDKKKVREQTVSLHLDRTPEGSVFSYQSQDAIKGKKIDVFLNLSTINLQNSDLRAVEHGLWELIFFDVDRSHGGPTGFWEVLGREEGIGAQLLAHMLGKSHPFRINSAFFNRGWSMTETGNTVQEGAVSMVMKQLGKLARQSYLEKCPWVTGPHYKQPGIWHVVQYLFRFYTMALKKVGHKFGNSFLGMRPERWSLFLGRGIFIKAHLKGSKPLGMPKDEFWADPFLFHYHGKDYLFFENYSYTTKKGKISCGEIMGDHLVNVIDVLDKGYHLSFPNVFEEEGAIYMMPETSENKRLELYKAVNFPNKWQLYATAFDGERVADPVVYTDKNGQKWLFVNKQMAVNAPMNSELHIYKMESLKLTGLRPHDQNPVLIDARLARNGGPMFKLEDKCLRPSQRNINGVYGAALNLNEIHDLSLSEFKETVYGIFSPNFEKGLNAMHHLHQTRDLFVFDAAYGLKKT